MASRFAHFYAKNEQNLVPLWSQIAEDRVQAIWRTTPRPLEKLFLVSVFAGLGRIYVLFFIPTRDQK